MPGSRGGNLTSIIIYLWLCSLHCDEKVHQNLRIVYRVRTFLTQDKSLNLAKIPPTFELIKLSDRGGLKWPSKNVLGVVITLWKIFTTIEQNPNMLSHFLTSNSRSILVQLALLFLESKENDDAIYECLQCNANGREMLHGILVTASNCFLNNEAKNINL